MIELGHREEELNRAFGRQMADAVDEAVLVGPERTRPILAGLRERHPGLRTLMEWSAGQDWT